MQLPVAGLYTQHATFPSDSLSHEERRDVDWDVKVIGGDGEVFADGVWGTRCVSCEECRALC